MFNELTRDKRASRSPRFDGATRQIQRRGRWIWIAALVIATMAAAFADSEPGPQVRNLVGQLVDPFDVPDAVQAIVFVFVSVDCPVSNRYAPVVQRLYQQFASDRIRFWLIYPNPRETPAAIRAHVASFGYSLTALRDSEHVLVRLAKATVTPETAVFGPTGALMYRGRIDNRYVAIGLERPAPTERDLEEMLVAIAAGRPLPRRITQPVGCFIADFMQ